MRRPIATALTVSLVLTALLASAPAAGAATPSKHPTIKKGVYRSPGYKGSRKLPKTGPAPAPPSVTLATNGWEPDVLVDAAGTAHIVWSENVAASGNDVPNDVLHYCRLPRGAKACDNPTQSPFDSSQTPSGDFSGPRILQIGDGLVVLTHRYPTVREHPDKQTDDDTLYAYTSTDGGTSWSAPTIVGNQGPSGGALVWGGASSRISVISDTQTGGTVVQTITAGQYTRKTALLGPGNEAYSGSLALDGDQPVAAFNDLDGNAIIRRLPPGADPTNADAWSRNVLPGLSDVRLAGGPSGVFLFGRPPSGGPYTARRVTDGVPGAPVTLPAPETGTGAIREFTEDPAGGLHGFLRDGIGSTLWGTDSTDGGRSWSSARLVAQAAEGSSLDDVQAGAAKDGGGVVVYRRDPTGLTSGTIALTAFGTLAPTNELGAGRLAGQGIPGAYAGCDRVSVGELNVTPTEGCLLPSVDPAYPGAAVSQGPIDLNGLTIVPDANVRILVDPRRKTIDTTGKVSVILRGGGIDLTLLRQELHIKLSSTAEGATLFDFDPAKLDLAGFPIAGRVNVKLTPTGVAIPLSLSLPGGFGGITAEATVIAESGKGVRLDSIKFALARAPIGPLEVRDLRISYTGASDTWNGGATVGFPPQPTGAALGADVTFVKGRFTMGNFKLDLPYPGVLIGPNTYFTQVRGGFNLDPITINVGASFGAFPVAPPNLYTVSVRGDLTVVIKDGVLLEYRGTGAVANISTSNIVLRATTDGYADLTAGYDVDLKAIGISGNLQGFVDGPKALFGATADATVKIAGIPATGQRAALSNKGIGVCYEALGASAYAGYRFGEPIPDGVRMGVTLSGCDLSEFEIPRPGTARAAQAGGQTFAVAAGTKVQNVELDGIGGTPSVTLRAPDGTTVTPADARAAGMTGPASALTLPDAARTLIVLRDPAPGTWTIVPDAGSRPIAAVLVARDVKPVGVTARVTARGARRVLRYTVRDRGTATVRFAERGRNAAVADLGEAKGSTGKIAFRPAGGPGGTREIVATVSRGDLPVSSTVVTRYRAPAPQRLRAPKRVIARRAGTAVTVRWGAVTGAHGYVVRVKGRKSGRVLVRLLGRSARSVRLRPLNADDGRLTVTVAASDARGRRGKAAGAKA